MKSNKQHEDYEWLLEKSRSQNKVVAKIAQKQLDKLDVQDSYLTEDILIFFNAWSELTNSRTSSFSVGYIPYSEQICWLNENDICNRDERKLFISMITTLDRTYVKFHNDKESNKPPKKPKKINKNATHNRNPRQFRRNRRS